MAAMRHHGPKKTLGRKGFIALTIPNNGSSSKTVRPGIQAGQDPEGRSCC